MGKKYNNAEYEALITDIFGDTFYTDDVSYRTRIQNIRQYTEIIIRRLLDYPCNDILELGHHNTKKQLALNGFTEPLFQKSLYTIRKEGNERSHTRVTQPATKETFENMLDSLFNLFAYLFYKYFQKYTFGSNNRVMSAFSVLPPIIRDKTLEELYNEDPENESIIEKLCLAKVKAYDIKTAMDWVDVHDDYANKKMSQSYSIYDICRQKIELVGGVLERTGVLYNDFESALKYYKEYGVVEGDSQEIKEFNDLMEFVFMGRREREREIEKIPIDNYILNAIT